MIVFEVKEAVVFNFLMKSRHKKSRIKLIIRLLLWWFYLSSFCKVCFLALFFGRVCLFLVQPSIYQVFAFCHLIGFNNNFTIYQTPIGPNADITLSKPISSIYIIGSTIEIAWNSTVITGNIGIYLVPYGLSIGDPIVVVSSSTTTYDWYIDPQNVVAGSSYRIRLVSTSDPSVYDESGLFQLTDNITPSIIVNYLILTVRLCV